MPSFRYHSVTRIFTGAASPIALVRLDTVMTDVILAGILKALQASYRSMRAAYFAFGDAVNQMRSHDYTWAQIRSILEDSFPDAKAEVGITFTPKWLETCASIAAQFTSDGGISSPDGRHQVTREQFATLALDDKQRERVTNLLAFSASDASKGMPKLRVNDLEKAIAAKAKAKTPAEAAKAVRALAEHMTLVESSIAAVDDKDSQALLHIKRGKLIASLDKAEKRVFDLRKQLKALDAEIEADAQGKQDIIVKPAHDKPRKRPTTATVARA